MKYPNKKRSYDVITMTPQAKVKIIGSVPKRTLIALSYQSNTILIPKYLKKIMYGKVHEDIMKYCYSTT